MCLVLQALAQHELLSLPFLDYVISVLKESQVIREVGGKSDAGDDTSHAHHPSQLPQAALVAMAAFLRYFVF